MQYRNYGKLGYQVSALGMGCMRLPRLGGDQPGAVDKDKAIELIQYAADHGISYFDSAFAYHNGESESILGEAMASGGRRAKVRIATKQPFHVMKTQDDVRKNLESTLKKLRSDYIDVYLIHNIQRGYWDDIQKRKIIEEYEKFKAEGLIRAIGFSFHGNFDTFKSVLSSFSWDMCQIQQNFLDDKREATVDGIKFAGEKGCALVIMEPLRGGSLANPPPAVLDTYGAYPVKRRPVEWGFRHLVNFPEISCILSGVTTLEQLKEDIEIFSKPDMIPNCLTDDEKAVLAKAKSQYESLMKVPCTGCEYCLPCPNNVAIPGIFSGYNNGAMFNDYAGPRGQYNFMHINNKTDASQCKECGACEEKCPQRIPIMQRLKEAHQVLTAK